MQCGICPEKAQQLFRKSFTNSLWPATLQHCMTNKLPVVVPQLWSADFAYCLLQRNIQVASSNATSLAGQQSLSSLASPSPQQAPTPSIFARTQGRSQFAPASNGSGPAPCSEYQLGALGSQEQEEAERLGFRNGVLEPPGRRLLQAHVLQQEMRSSKVGQHSS